MPKQVFSGWTQLGMCPYCFTKGPHKTEPRDKACLVVVTCWSCLRFIKNISHKAYHAGIDKAGGQTEPSPVETVTLTRELIEKGLLNKTQLVHPLQATLLRSDGKQGWLKRSIGRKVPRANYDRFVLLYVKWVDSLSPRNGGKR